MAQPLPIHFAPLQGFTDAIYRRAHARIFGGVEAYYAPFTRVEHGEIRHRDVRDLLPANNEGVHLIPQLLAPDAERALQILRQFRELGYREADVNLGCPFPMLVKRHCGSGMLPYPGEIEAMLRALVEKITSEDASSLSSALSSSSSSSSSALSSSFRLSVKLRLGWDNANECMALLPLLNELPLSHVVVHPRLGCQQYKGSVDLSAFEAFYYECRHPLYYNGDLTTVEQMTDIATRFPRLAGIVMGRGLLARPSLAWEYAHGERLSDADLARCVSALHAEVLEGYREQLRGGDTQLLTKMKTFWEYLLPDADRKSRKIIHKTSKLDNYLAAVSNLLGSL